MKNKELKVQGAERSMNRKFKGQVKRKNEYIHHYYLTHPICQKEQILNP